MYDPRAIIAEKNEKGKLEMQLKKQFVSISEICQLWVSYRGLDAQRFHIPSPNFASFYTIQSQWHLVILHFSESQTMIILYETVQLVIVTCMCQDQGTCHHKWMLETTISCFGQIYVGAHVTYTINLSIAL